MGSCDNAGRGAWRGTGQDDLRVSRGVRRGSISGIRTARDRDVEILGRSKWVGAWAARSLTGEAGCRGCQKGRRAAARSGGRLTARGREWSLAGMIQVRLINETAHPLRMKARTRVITSERHRMAGVEATYRPARRLWWRAGGRARAARVPQCGGASAETEGRALCGFGKDRNGSPRAGRSRRSCPAKEEPTRQILHCGGLARLRGWPWSGQQAEKRDQGAESAPAAGPPAALHHALCCATSLPPVITSPGARHPARERQGGAWRRLASRPGTERRKQVE